MSKLNEQLPLHTPTQLRWALEDHGIEDLAEAAWIDLIDACFDYALEVLFPGDEGRAEEWAEAKAADLDGWCDVDDVEDEPIRPTSIVEWVVDRPS